MQDQDTEKWVLHHSETPFEEDFEPDPFDVENPPLDDPTQFLEFLKWYHGDEYIDKQKRLGNEQPESLTYDGINPAEVAHAIEICKATGNDPRMLSFATIRLSANTTPAEVIAERDSHAMMKKAWLKHLQDNREQLTDILSPESRIYTHSTPSLDNVKSIMREGLLCWEEGLDGSAAALTRVEHHEGAESVDNAAREVVAEQNMQALARPHRDHPFIVIIKLPELTEEQSQLIREARERGERIQATSFYVSADEELKREKEEGGVAMRQYDARLDPKYITGYLDLETGLIHSKEEVLSST